MSMIPHLLREYIAEKLSLSVKEFRPASGGCINHGGELITQAGSYFLKWNDRHRYPEMFEKEKTGLALLQKANCLHVPDVIYQDETDGFQFILMAFIKAGRRTQNYWSLFGLQLAEQHRITQPHFGLDQDNYIGSLIQKNSARENGIDFFIEQRLEVQLALASQRRKITSSMRNQFEVLYKKLPDLLPQEKPALLHGDLWIGNVMVDEQGEPAVIDPAAYYGLREAELAFTQLFGGFEEEFYKAYHEAFHLTPGFDLRADVYNLYPMLVHANLFGDAYWRQVEKIVKRFV